MDRAASMFLNSLQRIIPNGAKGTKRKYYALVLSTRNTGTCGATFKAANVGTAIYGKAKVGMYLLSLIRLCKH